MPTKRMIDEGEPSQPPEEESGDYLRIYPHTTIVTQWAVDNIEREWPWIVRDRGAMLRMVRNGHGVGMTRIWTPSAWEPIKW